MTGYPSQQSDPNASHTGETRRPPGGVPKFQISLTLMLLMMVVFAFISAALFYAARVPVIREELSVLFYGEASEGGEDVGRIAHRTFIVFTFASPLLLACLLSLMVSVVNLLNRDST